MGDAIRVISRIVVGVIKKGHQVVPVDLADFQVHPVHVDRFQAQVKMAAAGKVPPGGVKVKAGFQITKGDNLGEIAGQRVTIEGGHTGQDCHSVAGMRLKTVTSEQDRIALSLYPERDLRPDLNKVGDGIKFRRF